MGDIETRGQREQSIATTRRLLLTSVGGTVGLGGCLGDGDSSGPTASETSTATSGPTTGETSTATTSTGATRLKPATQPVGLYGSSVALDQDVAVVGDIGFGGAGAAHVFERHGSNWEYATKLTPGWSNGESGGFAKSIALDGDTLLVGAPGNDLVYLYERKNEEWIRQRTLRRNGSRFGYAVAISNDTAIVGAPLYSEPERIGPYGAIFIYQQSDGVWHQQARLRVSEGRGHNHFGSGVTMTDGTALVSATLLTGGGDDEGVAFVLERSNGDWVRQAKLVPSEWVKLFGVKGKIALTGNWALINRGGSSESKGYVEVFERSNGQWNRQTTLTAEDVETNSFYVTSVALGDETALIGTQNDAGSVFLFDRGHQGWVHRKTVSHIEKSSLPEDVEGTNPYVTISDQTALVGYQWGNLAYIVDI